VKIVCTSCRSEGLPGVIGARPPYHDPRDTAGICWRHKLETLKRAQERGVTFADPRVRFLIIVARHAGDIFASMTRGSRSCRIGGAESDGSGRRPTPPTGGSRTGDGPGITRKTGATTRS
jgi:hypothetical protein